MAGANLSRKVFTFKPTLSLSLGLCALLSSCLEFCSIFYGGGGSRRVSFNRKLPSYASNWLPTFLKTLSFNTNLIWVYIVVAFSSSVPPSDLTKPFICKYIMYLSFVPFWRGRGSGIKIHTSWGWAGPSSVPAELSLDLIQWLVIFILAANDFASNNFCALTFLD